ncbi:hypothetical protein P43SY_000268 [Pythium insidiosum]|uniref:Uncharacterized protein n=1 Tax=Pythium insidiosum TaxID=114742 RepID=A0AAD5QD18_PYTIN|nr:hypothetical protein P43SY_000268 [Pythium insidiosum]
MARSMMAARAQDDATAPPPPPRSERSRSIPTRAANANANANAGTGAASPVPSPQLRARGLARRRHAADAPHGAALVTSPIVPPPPPSSRGPRRLHPELVRRHSHSHNHSHPHSDGRPSGPHSAQPVRSAAPSASTPGRQTRPRLFLGANAVMTPLVAGAPSGAPAQASPTSRSAVAALGTSPATALQEDLLHRVFTTCLASVFEALGKFQYQQATAVLQREGDGAGDASDESDSERFDEWKHWDAFRVMVRLLASCESTYHTMLYLQPAVVRSETIDQLYNKLLVLLRHLAEETRAVIQRLQQRERRLAGHSRQHGASPPSEDWSDLTARLTIEDLEFYCALLEQSAEFFALRLPMIEFYRNLATSTSGVSIDPVKSAKVIEQLLQCLAPIDHSLLATLRQSAILELRVVQTAFESDGRIAQYDFTQSVVAMHRCKAALRAWIEHIDALTDYPLFADGDDGDDDYLFSGSTYSNGTSVESSTLHLQVGAGAVPPPPDDREQPPPASSTYTATRRKSLACTPSAEASASVAPSASDATAEHQSTFSRLLSHKGSLLKRGLSVSSLRSLRGSGVSASQPTQPCGTPTNALEHAILGSTPAYTFASSLLTPGGNALNSTQSTAGGTSGFNSTNTRTVAAEMIAAAIAKMEREDGYALPVFQWSSRFYRSLVAKFSLYFHRWLDPLTKRCDPIAPSGLPRALKNAFGFSYLELMDVMLAKGLYRGDESSVSVMLILESDRLENKGARYHPSGYLCPSTSNPAAATATAAASAMASPTSAPSQRIPVQQQPLGASKGGLRGALDPRVQPTPSLSPAKSKRQAVASPPLFLNVEPEAEDDESEDFAPLWGLRGWPAVFSYPHSEPPMQHWPNVVSLIMDNRPALDAASMVTHNERRLKTCYYITRIDPAVHLVLILEGKRRLGEKPTQDFMQAMTDGLRHVGVFVKREQTPPNSS